MKPSIGDVVEIPTPQGLAYAQYAHHHDRYGAMLRVLGGLYEERPADFAELAAKRERFNVFFPLAAAIAEGIVEPIANEPVPEHAREFPLFRTGRRNPKTGKVDVWWFWDGEREWPVEELSDEQRDVSIRGIVNDTRLIERIVSGWTPRQRV